MLRNFDRSGATGGLPPARNALISIDGSDGYTGLGLTPLSWRLRTFFLQRGENRRKLSSRRARCPAGLRRARAVQDEQFLNKMLETVRKRVGRSHPHVHAVRQRLRGNCLTATRSRRRWKLIQGTRTSRFTICVSWENTSRLEGSTFTFSQFTSPRAGW